MLENLNFGGSPSIVDVLKKLLNSKDIEMKTDLEMEQIQVLIQMKWFTLCYLNPEKEPFEVLLMTMDYYLQLMTSYNRKSRTEIVTAISNMKKPDFKDSPIINDLNKG